MALFVLSSKDGWVNIMYTGLDAVGVDQQPIENYNEWRLLFFISFLLLVAFFVLNMFVGVVVENFHRCRAQQDKEERAARAEKRLRKLEKRRKSIALFTQHYYHYYYHSFHHEPMILHQHPTDHRQMSTGRRSGITSSRVTQSSSPLSSSAPDLTAYYKALHDVELNAIQHYLSPSPVHAIHDMRNDDDDDDLMIVHEVRDGMNPDEEEFDLIQRAQRSRRCRRTIARDLQVRSACEARDLRHEEPKPATEDPYGT